MAKINIDGHAFEVDDNDNLLKAALSLGFNLPYFCWHPCLHSVGACRQCAVKKYKNVDDKQGQIVMACMTAAADETIISINDPEARDFRAQIIEWLMINHPHDCPVCEEGGECHLQDMTLMTGHTRRRFRGQKRTHRNQDLGPFIKHEMNRCIACYRCVRYYRDYAGGDDLDAFGAHDHVFFGRHEDGALENEFSGNLVEVCPTGVFTDKSLGADYTRKWDLENAPGICPHCSLGCNTSPGARKGQIKRIQNRYHGEINGYFLCDRGRFGAGFNNRKDRPVELMLKSADVLEPVSKDHALEHLHTVISESRGIIGIGSPRATLEANFALRRLVGAENFSTGMAAPEQALVKLALDILQTTPAQSISLREVEQCDAVLVLGEDVTNTAPLVALGLHQSVRQQAYEIARENKIPTWHDRAVRDIAQNRRSPLYQAGACATKLDDVAVHSLRAKPARIAELGFAVAHYLNNQASITPDLDADIDTLAQEIAGIFKSAKRPLIVSGTSLGSTAILQAAANIAAALGETGNVFLTLPECNSAGLGLLGGQSVDDALERLHSGAADTAIVLENDLYQRANKTTVDSALEQAKNLIVIDHSTQATLAKATAVLPAGTFAESDGTLVNNEGRAQRHFQVYQPQGEIQDAWRWCSDLMAANDAAPQWNSLDDVITALAEDLPALATIQDAAPSAAFRKAGMRIPRMPHRYSGRTAMHADESVHERRPIPDADSALAYSMEGWQGQTPAALRPFAWTPGWNSNQQAITRFQDEVAGPLKGGDPGAQLLYKRTDEIVFFPAEVKAQHGWQAIPYHHIFGSDPLSALAPAVAARIPKACFTLCPKDAGFLQLGEGDNLELTFDGETHSLPVRITDDIPEACIGVPVGLDGLQGLRLPQELTL